MAHPRTLGGICHGYCDGNVAAQEDAYPEGLRSMPQVEGALRSGATLFALRAVGDDLYLARED